MTHIKRQKLISSTHSRGYNKNCYLAGVHVLHILIPDHAFLPV